MRPAWSGSVMTSFCCITGTTIFILFTNMSLNRLGFAMLNRGNRYSSLAIFRLHLFTLINSFSGHK